MTIAVQNLRTAYEAGLAIETPNFDAVEDELDLLEAELMKKGSLAYLDVDWANAFENSVKALSSGVHINALAAGLTALVQKGDVDDFTVLTTTLSQVLSDNWEKLHPASARSEKLKLNRAQDLLDAMARRLKQDPVDDPDFAGAFKALLDAAKKRGLDASSLEELYVSAPQEAPDAPPDASSHPSPSQPNIAQQPVRIGGAPEDATAFRADLDAKGRSQLKRDTIALAERIEAFRPKDPTPYYLRAFSATIEITAAPEADDNGVTGMNDMPRQIADSFEQSLVSPSHQGLKQLEQRLLNSPDWFEGQYMALKMAQALELNIVAGAIKHRVENRLRALPEFMNIKYSNGEPVISEKAREALLATVDGSRKSQNSEENSARSVLEELEAANASAGLNAALALLENKLEGANSERARSILALDRAEFLSGQGLNALARDTLRLLEEKLSNPELQEWDKPLFDRFKRLNTKLKAG